MKTNREKYQILLDIKKHLNSYNIESYTDDLFLFLDEAAVILFEEDELGISFSEKTSNTHAAILTQVIVLQFPEIEIYESYSDVE